MSSPDTGGERTPLVFMVRRSVIISFSNLLDCRSRESAEEWSGWARKVFGSPTVPDCLCRGAWNNIFLNDEYLGGGEQRIWRVTIHHQLTMLANQWWKLVQWTPSSSTRQILPTRNWKWLHSTTNFLANHFTLMQNYILQLAVLNKLCGFYTFSEYYRTVINTHWFYK